MHDPLEKYFRSPRRRVLALSLVGCFVVGLVLAVVFLEPVVAAAVALSPLAFEVCVWAFLDRKMRHGGRRRPRRSLRAGRTGMVKPRRT